ncbi:hypothetical protein JOF53_000072 [Crossiella equi]|uniref:DUF7282 domain-containing protein n=1 Tax=Crossiella equi TaxID=130796 RepID=A0ABS5A3P7_9PSEU|nr:hypothetical protein [Crossiella equi]MBP2471200.1 hypothetical protein [Crossiella equi]
MTNYSRNRNRKTLLLGAAVAAAGLVLAACGGGAGQNQAGQPPLVSGTGPTLATSSQAAPSNNGSPAPRGEADVDADDQQGDGTRVVLKEVELPTPGNVTVYDQAGKELGKMPVQAGVQRDVTLTLAAPLGPGAHNLRAALDVRDDDDQDDDDHDDRSPGFEDDDFRYTVAAR